MKKVTVILIGLFLMTFAFTNVNAQVNTSTVNDATAAANIIAPIVLTQVQGLDFGNIIAGGTDGTVTMPTTGSANRSQTGGATLQPATPGQQAVFNVTGLAGVAYNIDLPDDGDVTIANGGNTMAINGFNHDAGGTPTITGGDVDFNVGAVITVLAGQATGTYTGTYTVTVSYQ